MVHLRVPGKFDVLTVVRFAFGTLNTVANATSGGAVQQHA